MDMSVDQKAAKLLADALALMNDGGRHWYQGDFTGETEKGDKGYCASGALRMAAFGRIEENAARPEWAAYLIARKALKDIIGDSIPYWNDASNRTWADVRRAFRSAIKSLKK